MKKRIVCICILAALLLSACRPGNLQNPNGDTLSPGPGTTAPTQTTTPVETTVPTETTKPTETVPTVDDELEKFNALFGNFSGWYNRALTCLYENPAQINLRELFYGGFADEARKPTDEEWKQLEGQKGFDLNMDLFRLPVDQMNEVLTTYFGITLENVDDEGFANLVYLESTDCYYHMCTDTNIVEGFQATAVETQEDGSICVFYKTDRDDGTYVVTLMPKGEGYLIVSNLEA